MILLKLAVVVLLVMFVISAMIGLIGFLIDIIRHPQKHEKVKIIPSADMPETGELKEIEDGLVLEKNESIFGGVKNESDN
ncbi:MAG: hypothetical protein NC320_12460 [Clostridium sp.]|nr:hypothetical protein [Clostridium sp.]